MVASWISSTVKGALAGAEAAALLSNLVSSTDPLAEEWAGGRVLLYLTVTGLGILIAWCTRLWHHELAHDPERGHADSLPVAMRKSPLMATRKSPPLA